MEIYEFTEAFVYRLTIKFVPDSRAASVRSNGLCARTAYCWQKKRIRGFLCVFTYETQQVYILSGRPRVVLLQRLTVYIDKDLLFSPVNSVYRLTVDDVN